MSETENWDDAAATFDDQPDHGLRDPAVRAAWTDLLNEALPKPPAGVLDLGCGTGSLSVLLATKGYDVTGVDLSPQMLAKAAAKAADAGVQVTTRRGDAADPPLTGPYDVLLCRHVLWALPETDAVLMRWRRLLAPGGRLVLIEGRWETGAGITATDLMAAVGRVIPDPELTPLTDARLWGHEISDERYLITAGLGADGG